MANFINQKGPYHYTYLSKDQTDERRHKKKCVYYDGDDDHCIYRCNSCIGSSNCQYYLDKDSNIGNHLQSLFNNRYAGLLLYSCKNITLGLKKTAVKRNPDDQISIKIYVYKRIIKRKSRKNRKTYLKNPYVNICLMQDIIPINNILKPQYSNIIKLIEKHEPFQYPGSQYLYLFKYETTKIFKFCEKK